MQRTWPSLAGFALAVAGLVLLVERQAVVARGWPGLVVQLAAILLMVWARVTFGARSFHPGANPTDGELVTAGPYRYFRHPIYAAAIWFTVAAVVTHLSLINAALGGLVVVGMAVRMRAEERFLAVRYPAYAAYAAKTRRILPFVF
jgi:protein-S-isoprenylcysteine O-methyltransferase Ste14